MCPPGRSPLPLDRPRLSGGSAGPPASGRDSGPVPGSVRGRAPRPARKGNRQEPPPRVRGVRDLVVLVDQRVVLLDETVVAGDLGLEAREPLVPLVHL